MPKPPQPGTDVDVAIEQLIAGTHRDAFAVLGPHPALVSRVRDADGAVWQQVQWRAGGRIILVRYRGTLDQLLKMAGSIRE